VFSEIFNKTMQQLSAKLSKGGPRRPPHAPPLILLLDYMYRVFSIQEVRIALNFLYNPCNIFENRSGFRSRHESSWNGPERRAATTSNEQQTPSY